MVVQGKKGTLILGVWLKKLSNRSRFIDLPSCNKKEGKKRILYHKVTLKVRSSIIMVACKWFLISAR